MSQVSEVASTTPRATMTFSGQRAQWLEMGKKLTESGDFGDSDDSKLEDDETMTEMDPLEQIDDDDFAKTLW
jgi:hypothetical protein